MEADKEGKLGDDAEKQAGDTRRYS